MSCIVVGVACPHSTVLFATLQKGSGCTPQVQDVNCQWAQQQQTLHTASHSVLVLLSLVDVEVYCAVWHVANFDKYQDDHGIRSAGYKSGAREV
jgi:hypothetical protein